jgi:hypothetical protein
MPYAIWRIVIGPDIPPPLNNMGMGAFTLADQAAFEQALQ